MQKKGLNSFVQKVAQNRLIQHVLFWVLSFYILVRIFSTSSTINPIDYYYALLFHITLIIGVYFNLLVLIPYFFYQKKYSLYFLLLGVWLVGCTYFNLWFFNFLVDFIFPQYYFISYYEFPDIIQYFAAYLALTFVLKLSRSWFKLNEAEKSLLIISQEKTKAELKALRSQVNPHFLFNSLNNIYSLTLKKDKHAPELILKLSDAMRYMLYETKGDFVPLTDEVAFLNNFLDLQRLRSDQKTTISFDHEGKVDHQKIAPLLFIPLVENSFKHGIKGDIKNAYVKINLVANDDNIKFTIENNKGKADDMESDRFKGIGLENLQLRLGLIYPEKHKFEIIEDADNYKVVLNLSIK